MSTKYVPNSVFNMSVVYKTIGLKEIKTNEITFGKCQKHVKQNNIKTILKK